MFCTFIVVNGYDILDHTVLRSLIYLMQCGCCATSQLKAFCKRYRPIIKKSAVLIFHVG